MQWHSSCPASGAEDDAEDQVVDVDLSHSPSLPWRKTHRGALPLLREGRIPPRPRSLLESQQFFTHNMESLNSPLRYTWDPSIRDLALCTLSTG